MSAIEWLIDKSALARLAGAPDVTEWISRIERGLVHISTPTLLEIGYSAQGAADWNDRIARPPASLLPIVNLPPGSEQRALEVQAPLVAQGQHRPPSVADLLIAAIAQAAGLGVLHVDKDFDLIGAVTGQPVQRLGHASGRSP